MKLQPAEVRNLADLVSRLFTRAQFGMVVASLNESLERISGTGNLEEVAFEALTAANNSNWIDTLVEAIRKERKNDPELERFVSSVGLTSAPAADPYSVCIADNRPFVNRLPLRNTLRTLVDGGPRILVVSGNPRSGKTYTANLIKSLARQKEFEIVWIDLVRYGTGRDVTPQDIAMAIASQMGLGTPPTSGPEQLSRWTLTYFDWLVGQLRSPAKTWWLIIDGFQSVSVPQTIKDFVDELCARVDQTLTSMRAVLISYDSTKLSPDIAPILTEDVTANITLEDLLNFFLKFYVENKPALAQHHDERASSHAAETLAKMDAATEQTRHEVMGRELIARVRKILEETA